MTPLAVLVELLERVGAAKGQSVFVSERELAGWPVAAVSALKSQMLLTPAQAAKSVVCPGCEEECVMPVHVLSDATRGTLAFIVCDKRSDTSRVRVPVDRLAQWQCNAEAAARFAAACLALQRSEKSAAADLWMVGMAKGNKRSQVLCLRANGVLSLVAGNAELPLTGLVEYGEKKGYAVDAASVRQLVDSSTTGDPRYTPSIVRREASKLSTKEMYAGWHKAYLDLKRQRPGMTDIWYARQIAKTSIGEDRNFGTIKKKMK